MKSLAKKILALLGYTLIIIIISVITTVALVAVVNRDTPVTNEVTRDIVLDRVNEEAFLVTRTVYIDQDLRIKVDQDSSWNEFLWGKEIVTNGRVRVDVGVDFGEIDQDDIVIDEEAEQIAITVSEAEIFNASLTEKLTVNTEETILSRLFASDRNADYQLAAAELIANARAVVEDDSELLAEAGIAAEPVLTNLVSDLGYEIIIVVE